MKKRILFISFLLLLLYCSLFSQAIKNDYDLNQALRLIEVWLDAQLDYKEIPGISVGIVYDQDLIWSSGFGFADIEKKIPATPDTIYSICSISKLFTSISVIQLRDLKKLNLDEPLRSYLPWLKIKDKFPDAPEITLRSILTHSSGLPRESDFPYWTGPEFKFPTREEIIEKLSGQEELYPAETYFQYSNLGMALAGEVVATISGESYRNYVLKNILIPLQMKDTTPEIPEEHRRGRLAQGYSSRLRDGSRVPIPFYLVKGMAPAAGFASTVKDLARFASWQFRLLNKGGKEVLSSNSLKEMHRVYWVDPDWKTTWGLGFSVVQKDGKTYVGHGGSCPGYRTQLTLCPKDKIAIIFMTNAHDINPDDYVAEMFKIATPAILKKEKMEKQEISSAGIFQKFSGRYEMPIGREIHVLEMGEGLALIWLPNDHPSDSLIKLKHIEGGRFRRIREDGELGEEIFFEIGKDGKVERLIWNSQYALRVN